MIFFYCHAYKPCKKTIHINLDVLTVSGQKTYFNLLFI